MHNRKIEGEAFIMSCYYANLENRISFIRNKNVRWKETVKMKFHPGSQAVF